MESKQNLMDRWWIIVPLALAGMIAIWIFPALPSDDVKMPVVRLLETLLLYVLFQKITSYITRIPGLPVVWWTSVGNAIAILLAVLLAEALRARSAAAGWHAMLEWVPIAVVFALMAALPSPPAADSDGQRTRGPLVGVLSVPFVLGIIVGAIAGTPNAQQELSGEHWLWQPMIWAASFTWISLGVLFYRDWKSRAPRVDTAR